MHVGERRGRGFQNTRIILSRCSLLLRLVLPRRRLRRRRGPCSLFGLYEFKIIAVFGVVVEQDFNFVNTNIIPITALATSIPIRSREVHFDLRFRCPSPKEITDIHRYPSESLAATSLSRVPLPLARHLDKMSSSVDYSVGHSSTIHEIGVVVDWAGRAGAKSEIVAVTTPSGGPGGLHGALASSPSSRYIPLLSGIRDRCDGGDRAAGPEGIRGFAEGGEHARIFQSGGVDAKMSASVDFIVLGADPPVGAKPTSCFNASLGCLEGRRWVGSAKNKLWWMTPSWGTFGGDVPLETQFLLVELGEGQRQRQTEGDVGENEGGERRLYACLLPLICDGTFSGMLVGGEWVPAPKGSSDSRRVAQGKQRYVTYIF